MVESVRQSANSVVSHPLGIFMYSTGSRQKWPLQKWAPDVSHWDCICRNCGEEFKRNASKDVYSQMGLQN